MNEIWNLFILEQLKILIHQVFQDSTKGKKKLKKKTTELLQSPSWTHETSLTELFNLLTYLPRKERVHSLAALKDESKTRKINETEQESKEKKRELIDSTETLSYWTRIGIRLNSWTRSRSWNSIAFDYYGLKKVKLESEPASILPDLLSQEGERLNLKPFPIRTVQE